MPIISLNFKSKKLWEIYENDSWEKFLRRKLRRGDIVELEDGEEQLLVLRGKKDGRKVRMLVPLDGTQKLEMQNQKMAVDVFKSKQQVQLFEL